MSNFADSQDYYEAEHKQSLGGITLWIILIALFVMSVVAIALPFVIEPNKGEQGDPGENGSSSNGQDGKSGTMIESWEDLYGTVKLRYFFVSSRDNSTFSPKGTSFQLSPGKLTIWPHDEDTKLDTGIWKQGDFFRPDDGDMIKGIHYQISKVEDFDAGVGVPAHTELTFLNEPDMKQTYFGALNEPKAMSRLRFV